jgi:hypothetical protein
MHSLDFLSVFFREVLAVGRVLQEESVMHVSGWVTLRLIQSIKVPEGAFNESVSGHLVEAHLKEDLSEEGSNLKERMQVTSLCLLTDSLEVVLLELSVPP